MGLMEMANSKADLPETILHALQGLRLRHDQPKALPSRPIFGRKLLSKHFINGGAAVV